MSKNDKNIKDGFSDIQKSDKTIWRADQFGKRVVEDIQTFIIKSQIDNQTFHLHTKKKQKNIKN